MLLAAVLLPVPVEIRQSNITSDACCPSCFAPRFGGVQNVRTRLGILAHGVNVSLY